MRVGSFILLVTMSALAGCDEQPSRRTSAVVVDIAHGLRPKWDTDKVQIAARSRDGLMTEKSVPLAMLKCRVGDTVKATAQGLALTLDDRACV
jgi:hypothetical protein